MDNPWSTLITGIVTLLGVWLGSLINRRASHEAVEATHRNAIELIQINNRNFANIRLREAFAREIALLSKPEGYNIAEIPHSLKIAFEKHQTAINEFRFFLTGDELTSFNKAWKEYDDYPDFNKYIVLPATQKEDIQRAIDNINAILEFTKGK